MATAIISAPAGHNRDPAELGELVALEPPMYVARPERTADRSTTLICLPIRSDGFGLEPNAGVPTGAFGPAGTLGPENSGPKNMSKGQDERRPDQRAFFLKSAMLSRTCLLPAS